MDELPQEIIERIVLFLPGGLSAEWSVELKDHPIAQYAVISNKFRVAIERSMFKRLRINSDELEVFAQILTPSRRGFLRFLDYSIVLPSIDAAVSQQRYERPAETEVVSQLFSLHTKNFFDTLSRLDGLRGLNLDLGKACHLSEVTKSHTDIYGVDEFFEYHHLRAPIDLLTPNALPQLSFISRLVIFDSDRTLTSSAYIDLAARMPGLQDLHFFFIWDEVRYPGLLRKDRCILATTLKLRSEETKTISVATLDMNVNDDHGAMHQLLPMPNLIYPSGYDLLGSSLRNWSQRLNKFDIRGVFDETLFWPHALEMTSSPPEWVDLKTYYVQLERHTPSGWWYFMPKGKPKFGTPPRNPAEDPNDLPLPFTDDPTGGADPFDKKGEDAWDCRKGYAMPEEDFVTRNVPNEDNMQPLLEGWVKAPLSMPSLRQATLAFSVEIFNSRSGDENDLCLDDWEIIYEAPDNFGSFRWESKIEPEERRNRRLTFHNTSGWRPNKDTMDMLRRVGEDSYPGTKSLILDVDNWGDILR